MSSPRVSVVIPTRNSEKYLQEALDSILTQSFKDFEVLIVDDKSTDGTLGIIRGAQDCRVRMLQGPGKGLAAALNFAFREARGEYIARMDADDIAESSRLGKQVAYLDENPDVGVCGTFFKEFMGGDVVHDHMENVRYVDMLLGCYIGHPTAMLRRQLFLEHELFYDESMRFSEDYDLWTRAIRFTKLANLQEILLSYRRHADSVSIAHTEKMHALDQGVKVRMIDHLVGGLSQDETERVAGMLNGASEQAIHRLAVLEDLIRRIKYPQLCSALELVSAFHQIKPFKKEDLIRLSGDVMKSIPVFVISYNHLTYLKSSIAYFEKAGFNNIHIIDNASSYPPLLEYLDASPHHVHHMGTNYKHMVLFNSRKFKGIVDDQYFVLTDPDVLPVEECPYDFLYTFLDALLSHPFKNKVGFSLKIDDLPDHYALKENVLQWEGRFYEKSKNHGDVVVYDASVDTTLALYRPRREWRTSNFFSALRVGAPFSARHLPWYRNLSRLTDEELYYRNLDQGSSNWNGTMSAEQLHKKYGTSGTTAADTNSVEHPVGQEAPPPVEANPPPTEKPQSTFRDTFTRRRVGELRGYFLYGRTPLLNLHTISYHSIRTTLSIFGKIPVMSKTTSENRHVYRLLGVLPIWGRKFG